MKIHASPTPTTKKVARLFALFSSKRQREKKDGSTNRFVLVAPIRSRSGERGSKRNDLSSKRTRHCTERKDVTRLYTNWARWSSQQWRAMEKARTEPLVTRYPFARVVRFFGSSYVYFGEYSPADRYRSTTARSTSNRDRDQFSPVMEQVRLQE